ncbi:MAG: hypothetical protein LUG94_07500 [Ruminococcus sp.]|nr:hypothetical protein [Ruminococcus sp.]
MNKNNLMLVKVKASPIEKEMVKLLAEQYIKENNLSIERYYHLHYLYDEIYLVKEETQNFILTHIFDTVWKGKEGDHNGYYLILENGVSRIFITSADAYEPYYGYTRQKGCEKSIEFQAIDVYWSNIMG